MRHGNKINHLGRKTAHRKALLMNLSNALIQHKRITTTVAKAKVLRQHIEPLLNKTKIDTTHNRRILFSYLQDKESIKELFGVIADKIANRPGGYTRIIKLGFRKGDAADIAMIELVDFNEVYTNAPAEATGKKKSRRAGAKSAGTKTETKVVTEEKLSATDNSELIEDVTPIVEETSVEEVISEMPAPQVEEAAAAVEEFPALVVEETATETPTEIAIPENADDLKVVEGIGPAIEKLLHAKGIFTYAQLSSTPAEDVKAILTEAGGRFAIHDPATWAEQATLLKEGKMEEFKALIDSLDGGKKQD